MLCLVQRIVPCDVHGGPHGVGIIHQLVGTQAVNTWAGDCSCCQH